VVRWGIPRGISRGAPRAHDTRALFDGVTQAGPSILHAKKPPGCSLRQMPSRQERRAAERDAAKRAPAQAGAGGAGGAAAALASVDVNPLGDWTTQAEDPYVGPGGYCPGTPFIGCQLTQDVNRPQDEGWKCGE